MNPQNETAYCGIYCPDCIRYKNKYSLYADQLMAELENIEFHKYADIDSPFGANFKKYKEFIEVLRALIDSRCDKPCRVGGGCSGNPCKIMECCIFNGREGCWECTELDECENFDILEPRCGETPKNNIKNIKKYGIGNWVEKRGKFYVWQKQSTT
jgi:hypothetical protein